MSSLKVIGQVYENPLAAQQSHPDLKIQRIETSPEKTIIYLSITNQLQTGGWFCADSNIVLKNSKGLQEYKLIQSENIPICPQKHIFKRKGEELNFVLYFPPIDNNIKFLDLIENCDNACFSFEGIILDNEHNQKIVLFETAMDLFTRGAINDCIPIFKKVLEGTPTIESHIFGLSYYYLVLSYQSLADKQNSDYWYNALKESEVPLKDDILKELDQKLGF
ncbi:MAG: hypothetical protein A2W99_10775 [Bacteroidetes bacterium GWF2_33_16]|nr:MAG: hypothetical protein A2X00_04965 [Bacteroidetes bacterium GWE2_32_14]OFY04022.1 MAG: hypothetical protein A2W99_10775 [Bacteroidetes bacterium GWF2_33_16]